VFVRTLYYLVRGRRAKGAISEQMYLIGNRSVFFMCVTMAFLGAIIAYQSGVQVKRLIPDMSAVGRAYSKLLIRDLAASVGAMPLATRVGAGIAAEIGSMVVTEQTDALRMCAADPVDYLVVPRFVAATIMGAAVLMLGGAVAWFAAMFVVNLAFDVSPSTFANFALVNTNDVALGVFKCFTYGGAIAIVSAQRGLRAFGGSEGVGTATTEAVVGSLFAVIVLNFFISGIGHFLLPG
jgi:phospholipid/cholesterol/gamma-HCH transport system permease protein